MDLRHGMDPKSVRLNLKKNAMSNRQNWQDMYPLDIPFSENAITLPRVIATMTCQDVYLDMYSDILPNIVSDIYSDIYSHILSGKYSDSPSHRFSVILSDIHSDSLFASLSDIILNF